MQGFEILERARDARAKLLSVERLPAVGGGEPLSAALLLILDAGRVLVAPDESTGILRVQHLEDPEDVPSGLQSGMEDEPWWRLLGCPLSGVWSESGGAVLRLEWSADGAAPRFVTVAAEGSALRSQVARAPN